MAEAARWIQAQYFTIENEITGRQSANGFDHLGNGVTDLIQLPGIDSHLVAGFMNLDACPVELVFECWFAKFAQALRRRRPRFLQASAEQAGTTAARTEKVRAPRARRQLLRWLEGCLPSWLRGEPDPGRGLKLLRSHRA